MKDEFIDIFSTALEDLLARAPDPSCALARAREEELGYLTKGEWYWILGYASDERIDVLWVSDDFFIYRNPARHFELDERHLDLLLEAKAKG